MLDYKKSGREPIAWITRGGKHIPIFDKEEEKGKNSKEEKVRQINEAIARSEVAVKKGFKAEIIDGKIVYTMKGKSSFGSYDKRITFNDVLNTLWGDDIRKLKKLFGR